MKKAIITLAMIIGLMTSAQAVSKINQYKLSEVITEAGMKNMWGGESSLWIEANMMSKYELEAIGHKLCSLTRPHRLGFYVITFWHSFGHGKITKVTCSS